MSSDILVGYTATKAGRDAVALGSWLAAATGARLSLVVVLPTIDRSYATPPNAGYERYLRGQAENWLAEAVQRIPEGVDFHTHVRYSDSVAPGLTAAAREFDAGLIVVGAADGALRGTHALGTTSTELLHSAEVPVTLAPKGYRRVVARGGISRVSVAIGSRPGAAELLDAAAALAARAGAPVRLMSLVAVDLPASVDTGVIRVAGAAHADEVLATARAVLPDAQEVEAIVARGGDMRDAVRSVGWEPGEVLLAGSSRLAASHRLFLGPTAAKILRALPVPMIVVPRGDDAAGEGSAS